MLKDERDKDEFEPRVTRLRERLKQMEEQALQIKDDASLERELRLILGRLDEFTSRVKNGLDDADWSTRREIIRALVKRVEIDQEQVRVIFRVNPPLLAPQLPSEKDAQSLQHCGGRVLTAVSQHCLTWIRAGNHISISGLGSKRALETNCDSIRRRSGGPPFGQSGDRTGTTACIDLACRHGTRLETE